MHYPNSQSRKDEIRLCIAEEIALLARENGLLLSPYMQQFLPLKENERVYRDAYSIFDEETG